jgi:mRNA interferase MazF
VKRGEVWLTDFGAPTGPEQAGSRPAIILQHDDLIEKYTTVLVVPITSNLRRLDLPTSVLLPAGEAGLTRDSVVLCHQLQVRGKARLTTLLGKISAERLDQVEQVVLNVVGL